MEFNKGTKQAELYASKKSSSSVFQKAHIDDFIAGYAKAIEDSKSTEMFELLSKINKQKIFHQGTFDEIKQLLTKITE